MFTLKPEAITLLQRVKQLILDEPRRIDMSRWLIKNGGSDYDKPRLGYPKCGTVGCIGGWIEDIYRVEHPKSVKVAKKILGISLEVESELFFDSDLMNATNSQTIAHARDVAKHIDQFIDKYKGDKR